MISEDNILRLYNSSKKIASQGNLANYIPELLNYDKNSLGICIKSINGDDIKIGDWNKLFTIQSVSKVITLFISLLDSDIDIFRKKVSFMPTSDGFNSIMNLETKNENKPLNPFINSGAIITLSFIKADSNEEKFKKILDITSMLTGRDNISYNKDVYLSEKFTGHRNRALAYFLKSVNMIEEDVEDLLDLYFKVCSIELTCEDLANIGLFFAKKGVLPSGKTIGNSSIAKKVVATMMMCGLYNESGDFAINVGIPSKSGVGGGILTVLPNKLGIGIYGPSLNKKGSSIAGIDLLSRISNEYNLSIF